MNFEDAKNIKKNIDHQDFMIDIESALAIGLFHCVTDLQLS